ncbi:MAG: RHS repeat-associated core domain-containing protein [Acidimicrobiales bacterium]
MTDHTVFANGNFVNPAGAGNADYFYDGAGRLTQAILPATTYNYSYGPTSGCPANTAGANTNRSTLTVTGTGAGTTNYCYDNADRLVSDTNVAAGQIVYDTHGNQTQEGPATYSYDSADRLIRSASPTGITEYTRDPLDRPAQRTAIAKITAGATTTATTTNATAVTVTAPSGTQAGDLLVASVTTNATGTLGLPAGWSLAATQTNSGYQTSVAVHTEAAGDPSTWTFTTPVGSSVEATVDYHNPTGTPLAASVADPASTSQPLPAVTTTTEANQVIHIVGYNQNLTPTPATGDNTRATVSSTTAALAVSDRYQDQPGPTTATADSSTVAAASEAFTLAITPTTSTQRMGYSGETDSSGFTENPAGTVVGAAIGLPGGATYNTLPGGTITWSYPSLHGDTITTADNNGNRTWTEYWGPYGETANGPPPTDTALTGATYGYNGSQGKLTDTSTGIVLMGARPYSPTDGRFTQPDPIPGGCANLYTYAYGDPVNHPDPNGQISICGVLDAKQAISLGNKLLSGASFESVLSSLRFLSTFLDPIASILGIGASVLGHQLVLAGRYALADTNANTPYLAKVVVGIKVGFDPFPYLHEVVAGISLNSISSSGRYTPPKNPASPDLCSLYGF